MKSNVMIAGAIVTIAIVCIVALAAVTMALQGPAKSTQETNLGLTNETFNVHGNVADTTGAGISGAEVTLYIVGDGCTTISDTTSSASASVGQYAFDNAAIVSNVQYAYVSASISKDNITYYGRSDNFTVEDKATINKSITIHTPPGITAQDQGSPVVSQVQPGPNSICGYIITRNGKGIPGVAVTLHMMGADGTTYLNNVTTVTKSTEPFVGQYVFENVTPVDGTQFVYISASVHAGDIGIYGRGNLGTLSNVTAKSNGILLIIPPECQNSTITSP